MNLRLKEDGGADARIATVTALVIIIAVLLSWSWIPPLIILAATLCVAGFLAVRGKVRVGTYGRLMAFPLSIAAFVWLTFAYTFGPTQVYHFVFPIYQEGIQQGFLVFTRVLAATSVLLLLLEATSLMSILRAFRWMRVPEVLVDLMALVYRYIFVLEEERERLTQAMASRLGFARSLGYRRTIANHGVVASNLLVRSFDSSLRTYEAMLSRGYRGGRLYDLHSDKPRAREVVLGGVTSVASVLLVLGWWLPW